MRSRPVVLVFAHSPGLSGAERSLLETLALLQADCHIVLVAPGEGPFLDAARKLDLAAIHLIPQHAYYEKPGYSPAKKMAKAIINAWAVCRSWALARRTRPTLVYSNSVATWTGALVARLAGIPHVWHLRELIQESSIGRPVFGRALERRLLAMRGTAFLSNSAFVRDWYAERFGIRPTVAYQPVHAAEAVQMQPSDAGRTVIAVFGRLQPDKRQHVVVQALGRVRPEIRDRLLVRLYGTASQDYLAQLRAIVADHGLGGHVSFDGYTARAPEAMLAADLVAVPSLGEGFGRVAAEAMLLGVPVIGAASGGTLELLGPDSRHGALFPPDDVDAVARLITEFVLDPAPFRARAEAARQWALRTLTDRSYAETVARTFASVIV